MLPPDASSKQVVSVLSFLSRAGAKVSHKLLYVSLQEQDTHELQCILNELNDVAIHVQRIWQFKEPTPDLVEPSYVILNCIETLNHRISGLTSHMDVSDYSDSIEVIYISFCNMLEATLQLS